MNKIKSEWDMKLGLIEIFCRVAMGFIGLAAIIVAALMVWALSTVGTVSIEWLLIHAGMGMLCGLILTWWAISGGW